MQRFILIRAGYSLLALWVISVIIFSLIRVSGSPVDALLPTDATVQDRLRLEKYWGVGQPLHQQYFQYVANIFRGNFGESFKWKGLTTRDLILERIPATAQLAGVALLISVAIALPVGVLAAVKKDAVLDHGARVIALLGQSLPSFWLAIILIWIFAVIMGVLPTSGRGGVKHLILPAISLGLFQVAALMRLIRSSMLEVLDSEYVKLARIKGLPEWKVVWKHCLRNAAIAPLTYFGVVSAALLTGSVVVETVFAWPGLGLLALEAVRARDYAVVQTVILLFATIYIACNLAVDIMYAYLNPRIRYT